MPFSVLCLFVDFFLLNNLVWHAVASVLQFDLYTRPSEILALQAEDIFPPRRRSLVRCHSVVIAPSTRPGSTKTGKNDCTVLAGDGCRAWINHILVQVLRLKPR